jgi:hypothetical protein
MRKEYPLFLDCVGKSSNGSARAFNNRLTTQNMLVSDNVAMLCNLNHSWVISLSMALARFNSSKIERYLSPNNPIARDRMVAIENTQFSLDDKYLLPM